MTNYRNYQNELICDAYHYFGAHIKGNGVVFRVYAPNATQVSVAGDFNHWNYHQYRMYRLDDSGIFELWIEGIRQWDTYKYAIFTSDHDYHEKCDPYGFYHEVRPNLASKVVAIDDYMFQDQAWMQKQTIKLKSPMNIYELHVGSWRDGISDYVALAYQLIPYLRDMGYNVVELMPIMEHPFDGSWGYQVTGFYSITSRYGSLCQFKEMIDIFHQANIAVLLDIVPTHFVKDEHGLRLFDGTTLYEEHQESEWGTLFFDYSKLSVQNFFISSVAYWLDTCHIDGVRMDAVSNLIHRQGRKDYGLNENGLHFLKTMNEQLKQRFPNAILIAEDSSDYGHVCTPVCFGGLGFDYKWDLGWMNDTLKYYGLDPIHKRFHHHQLSFSMAYFHSEKFILPLSHDEVVHGKKNIIDKMWGTYEQKFALLKNLYVYMMTHPGKKLNFMGNELAHFREWDEKKSLDWFLLDYPKHHAFKRFMKDMNQIYLHHGSLWEKDYHNDGFCWLDVNNAELSIFSYLRISHDETLIVVLNMTGVSYESYHIPVPASGTYWEVMNSEKDIYDGCNMCNYQALKTIHGHLMGYDHYMDIRIAPFGAIVFKKMKGKDYV
ncbi:MAG: 1,4-alpha-glucan branching protein GlgB [Breznakia sp.]